MENPNLANAGQGANASAPISGADTPAPASAPASEPKTGMQGAFERAQERVDPEGAAQRRQERSRQANGKFAPNGSTQTNGVPAVADKPLEVPQRWPEARKTFFSSQPREIQQAMLDLNNDWNKGFSKQAEEYTPHKQFAESVRGLLDETTRSQAKQAGLDDIGAIRHSIQLVQMFNKDPVGFIGNYMARRGIDPRIFIQGQDQNGQPQPNAAQQFAPIVQPLMDKVQALEAERLQRVQAEQAQRSNTVQTAIAGFVQETDDAGSLKFPHVERVVDHMVRMIETDPRIAAMAPRERLEAAYQAAVVADPDLRQEIIAAEAQKVASTMQQSHSTSRLKAAATVKPAAASGGTPAPAKGLAAAFERARRQVGS